MGAFFTNVQVQVVGTAATALAQVVAAIRAAAKARGLVEVKGRAAAGAARRVAVVGGRRWIAVYDESTETQDLDTLAELAGALSRAGKGAGAAVSVLVHDSDIVELGLWRGGTLADRWNSRPDYFGKQTRKQRAAVAGDAARWGDLVGAKTRELAAVWRTKTTFAEEQLTAVAALLGIAPERAITGFNYLAEQPLPRGAVRLAFRDPAQPAAATRPVPATGLPAFEVGASSVRLGADLGEACHLYLTGRNVGGAGQGVRAVLWGDAIDAGLIEPVSAEVFLGDDRSAKAKLKRTDEGWEAAFPRFVIAAGITNAALLPPDGRLAAQVASDVHLQIRMTARASGRSTICMALVPHQNEADGQVGLQFEVQVGPSR
jgi:hypothetical protein